MKYSSFGMCLSVCNPNIGLACIEVHLYGNVKMSKMSHKELMQLHISKDHSKGAVRIFSQWYPGTKVCCYMAVPSASRTRLLREVS